MALYVLAHVVVIVPHSPLIVAEVMGVNTSLLIQSSVQSGASVPQKADLYRSLTDMLISTSLLYQLLVEPSDNGLRLRSLQLHNKMELNMITNICLFDFIFYLF